MTVASYCTTMPSVMWPREGMTNWIPCSGRCPNILHGTGLITMWFSCLWVIKQIPQWPYTHVRQWWARGHHTLIEAAEVILCMWDMPTSASRELSKCLWWFFLWLLQYLHLSTFSKKFHMYMPHTYHQQKVNYAHLVLQLLNYRTDAAKSFYFLEVGTKFCNFYDLQEQCYTMVPDFIIFYRVSSGVGLLDNITTFCFPI